MSFSNVSTEIADFLKILEECPEYTKMLNGEMYNAMNDTLFDARHRAKQILREYNATFGDSGSARDTHTKRLLILRRLIPLVDDSTIIEPPFLCDYGVSISIGKEFYANYNCTILDCASVKIGDRVMFGPNVSLYTATHTTNVQPRREGVELALPISIGDDCWICGNVTIVAGVNIGRGSTVAAGSVVTKDVDEFTVVSGIPAKFVKRLEHID
ncbi:putative acetyltransferase [Neolecta irregularis DAH-3]|uniref:Putative acetyltransferase n=1 Tax=Neolecta irregularis (strain DAH-3) TaxID=1198029 RepID=A0A1U7LM35_NEOID|nr:putative acetyltransferase [Neolecta irregularis DAH-3]|eukprot:OLL23726.1 putative acetyltransferase [Neolecta irregularis DAH-3]